MTEVIADSIVWDAVNNAAIMNGKDLGQATIVADQIIDLIDRGNLYDRKIERTKKIKTWKSMGEVAFSILAGAVLFFFIYLGISSILASKSNDYAGYNKTKVWKHDEAALGAWVSTEATLVNRKKSNFGGNAAWATTYRLDGREICVYVWDSTSNLNRVKEGACK